ncbi:MAG: glycosyltransferase family 4 protein [Steroidobacteraceae bacterium]
MILTGASTERSRPAIRERWLFVDGAAEMGGHEVMLLRWIEELRLQGRVQPVLLCRSGSRLAARSHGFSSSIELAPVRRAAHPAGWFALGLRALRDAWHFMRAIGVERPALCIVAEGCLLAQPVFAFVARVTGQRVAVYVPLLEPSAHLGFRHGRWRDAFVRRIYANLPHAWVTITSTQAQNFATWAHVRRPVFNLPNTVARNIDDIARAGAAGEVRLDPYDWPRLRVLVLGRIEAHQKGLDHLVDYLTTHESLGRSMTVTFVGEGPYESELRRRIANTPAMSEWVAVEPWGNPVDVLKRHDVLLIPSRYEGVPLVMLEAMAIGVAVVATDLPGTNSFLPEQCLFPVDELERCFDIIATLADSRIRRQVVWRNLATYNLRASAHAFSDSVRTLTADLRSHACS